MAQTADASPGAAWTEASERHQAWLAQYYRNASHEAMAMLTRQQLIDAAIAHRAQARTAPPLQGALQLIPRADGPVYQLFTLCPDRPFLVDTLQLTLRRHGAQVIATFHPQMGLIRDGDWPEPSADAPLESLIQVQFNWLGADAAKRADLERALEAALTDLQQSVDDFAAMTATVREAAEDLRSTPEALRAEAGEVAALLDWMTEGHFTFLGVQPTVREAGGGGFRMDPEQGLGLAARGRRLENTDRLIAARSELDRYAESTRLVVVTQSTTRASVHHDEPLDVISIKRLDRQGQVVGTLRLIGLFTTDVYIERPRHIPLLRQRVSAVIARAGFSEGSHGGRSLRDTLAMLPRSELWQSSEDELYALGTGVMELRDRHHLRLFLRRDRYGRFFSALMYLPRDRYGRSVRDRLVSALQERLGTEDVDRSVEFPRGGRHACIRVRLMTPHAPEMPDDLPALEQSLLGLLHTWAERLVAHVGVEPQAVALARRYGEALPVAYQDRTEIAAALADIEALEALTEAQPIRMRLPVHEVDDGEGAVCFTELKLYSRETPAALSTVLPWLEHFGLFVTGQEPTRVAPMDGRPTCWIHRFEVRPQRGCAGAPKEQQSRMEQAFTALLAKEIEDDPLNALVLSAGITAREGVIIRAVVRYLVQTGLPYSQAFIEHQLVAHPEIVSGLLRLFLARHLPDQGRDWRSREEAAARAQLDTALDAVPGLDADRILRAAISVVDATLRTNYALNKPVLSLKLDPAQVIGLPKPLPKFEIYVYSPTMEGVHLRGGKVARGGLRWSDRPQDFRTEVLGLVKAQQVKNSIIVPVGAKGGFVVKTGDRNDREAWAQAGRAAYVAFLEGLLDLTDNLKGDVTLPPPQVVCRDAPDPYLVVAADKGTAQFSDLANETAARYDFWLGDAFASGGSQGYDHKKMGITARGAWESVKRHFRELGSDIQATPFTVVGIGDMGGDVFGNGMLLSEQIRLIAAFDHRHIFIDPDPDPARSFAERQRLFDLPRSSWDDYDRTVLSRGGGIYPRDSKQVTLSEAACEVLGLAQAAVTPQTLMAAILKAPVDLFWNGGIGTFVKARSESHAEVGDRANDALRINGQEMRARVVGEGGNLGFTQEGRVEFALNGGRIFTDAIDNAGGVHSSDREVNIKIPLNRLMMDQTLSRAQRDPLLVEMTEALAAAVLDDNLIQSGALSLAAAEQADRLDEYLNLMLALEQAGRLDRVVDGLPDDEALQARRRSGQGLTAPELAVIMAHTKIAVFDDLIDSSVPDDPAFEPALLGYFPEPLVARFGDALKAHQLRREIIATVLANAICNRMGMPFVHRLATELGVSRAAVVHAWAAAVQIVDADRYWQRLDVPKIGQFERDRDLHQRTVGLLKHLTRGLLPTFSGNTAGRVGDVFGRHVEVRTLLDTDAFSSNLPTHYVTEHRQAVDHYRDHGHPEAEAELLARTRYLGAVTDLVRLCDDRVSGSSDAVAHRYFEVGDAFDFPGLHAAVNSLKVTGQWPALARAELRDELFDAQRQLTQRTLADAELSEWMQRHAAAIAHAEARLDAVTEGQGDAFVRLTVAARALTRLATVTEGQRLEATT